MTGLISEILIALARQCGAEKALFTPGLLAGKGVGIMSESGGFGRHAAGRANHGHTRGSRSCLLLVFGLVCVDLL